MDGYIGSNRQLGREESVKLPEYFSNFVTRPFFDVSMSEHDGIMSLGIATFTHMLANVYTAGISAVNACVGGRSCSGSAEMEHCFLNFCIPNNGHDFYISYAVILFILHLRFSQSQTL
jgi:hypothetical protein